MVITRAALHKIGVNSCPYFEAHRGTGSIDLIPICRSKRRDRYSLRENLAHLPGNIGILEKVKPETEGNLNGITLDRVTRNEVIDILGEECSRGEQRQNFFLGQIVIDLIITDPSCDLEAPKCRLAHLRSDQSSPGHIVTQNHIDRIPLRVDSVKILIKPLSGYQQPNLIDRIRQAGQIYLRANEHPVGIGALCINS